MNKQVLARTWRKRTLVHCWWECRLVQPLWKTVRHFLKIFKMELPFGPVIPLWVMYPKNPETSIQKNLCTSMFIATLFIIAKILKQPKCPLVDEWIKKPWYICTMEYYTTRILLKRRNCCLLQQHRWNWRLLC